MIFFAAFAVEIVPPSTPPTRNVGVHKCAEKRKEEIAAVD